MKRSISFLFCFALIAGCANNKGPKNIPKDYWVPLEIGLLALQDTSENYKYKLLRDIFEASLPPGVKDAVFDSATTYEFKESFRRIEWYGELDSARIMARKVSSVIAEGSQIGKEFHNDYEEWANLGYQRLGYVQGVVNLSTITLWEGTFASGVDAVNTFYRTTENRIIPITAALYLMNQRLQHGLTGETYEEKVSMFRKAAHTQAAGE